MALPAIGFDLQDLIDEGLISTVEPSRRNNPTAIDYTTLLLNVAITLDPAQIPGELFDVDWGDGTPVQIMPSTGADHDYAAAGTFDIIVRQQGSSNWFIRQEVTVSAA